MMLLARRFLPATSRLSLFIALGASIAAFAAACGAGGDGGLDGAGGAGGSPGAGGGIALGGSTGTTTTTTTTLPPEHEDEASYGTPVATGKFVWIANPSSGRVAYIDATTLEIKLVDAGNGPTFLAPVPDPVDDVAVVLNVLSLDATVLRHSSTGLRATSIALPSGGNAWAVSRDGRWAIAWTDSRGVVSPDPVDGYQDITVIDLTKDQETGYPLTVGYRPVAMAFDAASARAFAVTQDGISVVDLGAEPAVVRNIKLADTQGASTRDVSITPDGSYALVRRNGDTTIGVFSLADGTRVDVALPAPATDLDLSPDGSAAIAVVRDTQQVAILPVPGIFADPTSLSLVAVDALVGSAALAAESPVALLYTNAVPSPVLGVMDTSAVAPAPHTILLRAPIRAVFPTPDAANALVLHDALTTSGSHFPAAFSLVPVALDLPPKIVGLDAPAISVAVSPAGDRALIATGSESTGSYGLSVTSFPSLKVTTFPLASLPIAAGIVAGAQRGFVAQKHPDGRITFVDLKTSEARTITGFELATQVVDGSK